MKHLQTNKNWELQRWKGFQAHFKNIFKSNDFQKERFPKWTEWESWKDFDDFTKACPLTTKQELEIDRTSSPSGGRNFTYPADKYVRYSRTSGTTGDPTTWMDTEKDWHWNSSFKRRSISIK